MTSAGEPPPAPPKPKPASKPRKAWPMEEALANIETYAAGLREWIWKLRSRLH